MSAVDVFNIDSAFSELPVTKWVIDGSPRSSGGIAELQSGGSCENTYYQRVYDDTNEFWCYYSGLVLNPTPGMTDTTPNNSGNISGYCIVITICS
jgi:hypothetical protein